MRAIKTSKDILWHNKEVVIRRITEYADQLQRDPDLVATNPIEALAKKAVEQIFKINDEYLLIDLSDSDET